MKVQLPWAMYLPPLFEKLGEAAFAAQCIPVEASLLEVESYNLNPCSLSRKSSLTH